MCCCSIWSWKMWVNLICHQRKNSLRSRLGRNRKMCLEAVTKEGLGYTTHDTSYFIIYRDRRDRKIRDDTDIDTFWCPESRPILIPILRLSLHRDRYWYWYHENVPGLILIPIFYLIRILPRPSKKCSGLWIDTDTDTETPEIPGSRLILILAALVSVLSIRYRYSRLSLNYCRNKCAPILKLLRRKKKFINTSTLLWP